MTTSEHQLDDLNHHLTRALQELLAGRVPSEADTTPLTGTAKVCLESLTEALHAGGLDAVKKAFNALIKDQPWLGKLASQPVAEVNPDWSMYRFYQRLVTAEAPESISIEDSGPLGPWQELATEMYEAWSRDGVAGVKAYIRGFNNLKQKGDQEKRLLHLISGEEPPATLKPEQEPEEKKPERRIRFLPLSEFMNRPAQQWLIPDILPRDGLTLVYGQSGGLKTFLVMDWSFCLVTGTPWLGRRVAHGPVAYIMAEGDYGIQKRSSAWLVHHQRFFRNMSELDQQVPLHLYDKSIILQESADVAQVIAGLQEDFQEPPLMLVIDTLSRCSAGADEVSNTEMARVLASADAIREQLHCTVVIVHHEGKDRERGPRGASALLANIETAILVTPNDEGTKVESVKAKDAPKFKSIYLEAKPVSFGPLPDDSSLVLVPSVRPDDGAPRMSNAETTMYTVLLQAPEQTLTYSAWIKAGMDEELGKARIDSERTAQDAISALKKAGHVSQEKRGAPYYIPQKQQETEEV